MGLNEAMSICFKKGIKVYPIKVNDYFLIEYSQNGVPKKRYTKEIKNNKSISEAMKKTYIFLAKKT